MTLREDANYIIEKSIAAVLPDEAVVKALSNKSLKNVYMVAVGKAAWQMAKAVSEVVSIKKGIVITKYDHVKDSIPNTECYEAGHPIPDENSFAATQKVIDLCEGLTEKDTVLLLLSGGGSALFEKPLISGKDLQDITNQLLASGAEITEINTIRKRLSAVKGGKFAQICAPAKVFTIVLSDIIGNPLDMIASGPAYPDSSTAQDALDVIKKYSIKCTHEELLALETPKSLDNVETVITGSVSNLCKAAATACKKLGYEPTIITETLNCEAQDAGKMLAGQPKKPRTAIIAGGETVLHLTGSGKGGRNQEIALSAADEISGQDNVALFSVGSDGTDGPTDAAGGYVDGSTKDKLIQQGVNIKEVLKDNDSYNALKLVDGLIITGPTGTNVNDVSVMLVK